MEKCEIEIWKNTDGVWILSVEGVTVAKSRFEKLVRDLAQNVREFNTGIEFVEI